MSPLFIGIDPGASGAIALIDTDNGLVQVADMPLIDAPKKQIKKQIRKGGKKAKKPASLVCGRKLAGMLKHLPPDDTRVAIELVNAMPRRGKKGTVTMGATSMFNFGNSAGVARGVVEALDLRMEPLVSPIKWKRFHGLLGTTKDAARVLAIKKFPALANDLKRKRDGGRADAVLIADFLSHTVH